MPPIPLRPYQQALLDRWQTLPHPRRLFLAWDMGAGKTIGALSVVAAQGANKVLIVCPALVRAQWCREAARCLPGATVGAIETGTSAKHSRAQHARRAQAMACDVQVVSYDLVHTIARIGWQFIIIDEFHALRSVASQQSQNVRALFLHNPDASALGLSGTPIPNEAKQLWNPVDTFFPNLWGKQTRRGYEPYPFVARFCRKDVTEYGTRFYGLREETRHELAHRFARISDRVTQADFAQYLPPLFVEPLEIKANDKPWSIAKAWMDSLPESAAHRGIYCHLRDTARRIHAMFADSFYIDGSLSAEERDDVLRVASAKPGSIIVSTTHALREGISLSFQKAALVVEWTSDVANVVQFLGRFARQDSVDLAPTRVSIAIGPNDVGAAQTIHERITDINAVLKSSRSTEMAASAFVERELSDDAFLEQLQSIAVSHETRTQLWSAEDHDDGEED